MRLMIRFELPFLEVKKSCTSAIPHGSTQYSQGYGNVGLDFPGWLINKTLLKACKQSGEGTISLPEKDSKPKAEIISMLNVHR